MWRTQVILAHWKAFFEYLKSATFFPVECKWIYLWQVIACIGALSAVLADRQLDTLMRTAFESLLQVNTTDIDFITLLNWQLPQDLQFTTCSQHLTIWQIGCFFYAFVCQDVARRRQISRVKIRQTEVTMAWQTLTNLDKSADQV